MMRKVIPFLSLLLFLFAGISNCLKAASTVYEPMSGSLQIYLNTNNEALTISRNTTSIVVVLSGGTWSNGVGTNLATVSGSTLTINANGSYTTLSINSANATGCSVRFINSTRAYTKGVHVNLSNNPGLIQFEGYNTFNANLNAASEGGIVFTPQSVVVDSGSNYMSFTGGKQNSAIGTGGHGVVVDNALIQSKASGELNISGYGLSSTTNPEFSGVVIRNGGRVIGGNNKVDITGFVAQTGNGLGAAAVVLETNSTSKSYVTSTGSNVFITGYGRYSSNLAGGVLVKANCYISTFNNLTITGNGSKNATANTQGNFGVMVYGGTNDANTAEIIGGNNTFSIKGYGGGADTASSGIGVVVGYVDANGVRYRGRISTPNGGTIEGYGSTTATGNNQHGIMILGSGVVNAGVKSHTLKGQSGTLGDGYGVVIGKKGFVQKVNNPATTATGFVNINADSYLCLSDSSTAISNQIASQGLRFLPLTDSTDFVFGDNLKTDMDNLTLSALEFSKLYLIPGCSLHFGHSFARNDFIFKETFTQPAQVKVLISTLSIDGGFRPRAVPVDIVRNNATSFDIGTGTGLKISINGNTPDVGYDVLSVTGDFSIQNFRLELDGSYVPTNTDTFNIIKVSGVMTGPMRNLDEDSTILFNGRVLKLHFTSNAVYLITVPVATTLTPAVTLASSNNGSSVCPGTPITFTASEVNGGATPTYTFIRNNNVAASGSNSSWTLNNPANGDVVKVVLTSSLSNASPTTDTSSSIAISVKSTSSSNTNLSICDNLLPYTWNGLTFNGAGTQTKTGLTNAAGCDSSATLNLSVKSTSTSTSNLAICPSALPYSWNGLTFTASGTQTKTGLTNAAGCDSSATLNLTVKSISTSSNNLAICPAQLPYTWNGLTFNAAGTQTKTGLTNAAGCDSSATLILSIQTTDTSVSSQSICASQLPYTWNGLVFNAAGTQTKTGLTGSSGCDSAATLMLTVNQPTSSSTNLTICDNQLPYSWNGLSFTGAGTQTKSGLINAAGCDSSATLVLSLNSSSNSLTNLTICEGQLPYSWNGLSFTTAGTQTKTGLVNIIGCDSSATLILSVTPSTTSSIQQSICAFQLPYTWNGLTFNAAGTQTKTGLTNAAGCDSSATLLLAVNPTYGDTSAQSACLQYIWQGNTYTQSGFYQDTLISSVGCDSIVSLQLTINQPDAVNASMTACGSYTWNSITYTSSGVYIATLANQFGCDSVVTLSLTINPNLTPAVTLVASSDTLCLGASVTFTASSTNGGSSPVYDFRLNGLSVQSSSTSTYTSTSLANNDTVAVVITSNNTCQTASTASSLNKVMTVNPVLTPTVSMVASDDTICAGTSVTFTATATNPGVGALYEFFLNGVSAQSGTSTTFTSNSLANQDSVWVMLSPTNTCQITGTVLSLKVLMKVDALPSVTLATISDMAISADSILLSFTPAGGILTGSPGISGNFFRPWTVDSGTVTVTYSYTNAQGCSGNASRSFQVFPDAIVWDGSQWKYGTPGPTQGSLDLMVLSGTSPAIPNNSACRNLVLRGGLLTHSLNNLLTINNNLNLRGGLMSGGGTLQFTNAAANVTATGSSNEFRADIEIPAGSNLQNINAFRLGAGSNVMAGVGTPNGGGTTSGSWTMVQRGSTQLNAWNAFSSPVLNGTGRLMQGAQHFRFNVGTQTWEAWDSNLVMTPGRGYITRAATNGWFRGTLHNANYSYAVTKNATGSSWNLVGNPYPSQLSWSDFLAANPAINGTAYFMKSNVNVTTVVNDYTAINGLMIGAEVPVCQGFFVEANTTGSVNFTNSMRRAGRTAFYTRTNQNVDLIWLKAFQQSDSAQASTTVVGFKADATSGFDRMYDGRLLKGDGSLFVYSLLNQEPMAIQGLPTLSAPVIIPLGVDASVAGNVVFQLDSTNMDPTVRILLEDLQLATTHNLRLTPYQTQITAGQNQTGRFRLLVNPFAVSVPTLNSTLPLHLYAYNQTLVVDQLQGRKLKEVRLTDISGRMLENWQQPQGESRIELPTTVSNGVYLMTVITTDGAIQTERVVVQY